MALTFRPSTASTVFLAMVLPVFVWLGNWQLDRAEEKQQLYDSYTARFADTPVTLTGSEASLEAFRFRKVTAKGEYLRNRQFLRDNRISNGRPGYHVLTPFRIQPGGKVVLVNRGWVPLGADRRVLPNIRLQQAAATIRGLVEFPDPRTIVLGDEEPEAWPRVVQKVDFTRMGKALGTELLPMIVQLDADLADGYVREWQPFYGISPDKHRAYALQWFSFAFIALLIYLGVNTKRVSHD